jgi:tetratricopeptide (TPR) repeat protein/transcriptional regulator with XRE-family HTH domain
VTEEPALDFAGLLRQLRAAARLTQEELAEAARVSPRTVSDLERGVNRTAHKDTAGLLADALGLASPVRGLFVAAARGRVPATQVLAAWAEAPTALAAAVIEGLPGPAAAPVPVPRELPADVGGFTGRAIELAELDLLLPSPAEQHDGAAGPVVISAVSGTAGVGKTALAVRWAHRMADAFPDGQLYVNLRGYDPDRPVPAAEALAGFLRALGVAGQEIPLEEAERAARFRSLLAGRRLLVVLDNAATVEQVRPLLPGSPSVMVLVTSRDALAGLVARDGARRLDLDLLPAADAAALLRALIGGRAEADPAAAEMLAGLCARLPLALRVAAELAISRPDTPLAVLATELAGEADRLALLDAGGDPRSAVASVFSWSYQHLTGDAARMFRLLGLHPGPDFDRYAAAALAGESMAEAGRLLAGLARAHLIAPAGPGRYSMHDLLRAYAGGLAATRDDDDSRHAALTALFEYYLAACAAAMDCIAPAERHYRPAPPPTDAAIPELGNRAAARAWLNAELATLVAVAAYTASNGWPGHTTRLARALHRYLEGGHAPEGLTICGHALKAARECDDRTAQAYELTSIGIFHSRQGRQQQAADYLHQALALACDTGDRLTQSRALGKLGIVHDLQGRYQQAIDYHQQALALARELGDHLGEVVALTNLGAVHAQRGRYQQAASHQRQALALFRELGDPRGIAIALANLGEACYQQGRYLETIDHQRQALVVSREIGDRHIEAEALTRLADVYRRQGHYDQAAEYDQQALALFRQIGDHDKEADALNGAGETLLAVGQPTQARTCHTTALTLTRQTGNQREQARALARLGDVCRRQADYDQAAENDQQALALFRQIGDHGGEADALNGAGETLLAAGQPGQARDRHAAALTLARQTGDRYQQARAYQGLASACQATGQLDQGRRHGQRALELYTDLGVPDAARLPAILASAADPSAGTRG